MQSLSEAISREFEPTVRNRGVTYFREGRVRRVKVDNDSLSATVEGSDNYKVRIKWKWSQTDGMTFVATRCDCPYAIDNFDCCKHVWAVLLAADDKIRPKMPPAMGEVEKVEWEEFEYTGDEGDTEDPDSHLTDAPLNFEANKEKIFQKMGRLGYDIRTGSQLENKGSKVPAYEKALQMVPYMGAPPKREARPPIGEISYVIDQEMSLNRGHISMVTMEGIRREEKEGKTLFFGSGHLHLDHSDLVRMTDDRDRMICGALLGASAAEPYPSVGFSLSKRRSDSIWFLEERTSTALLPELAKMGRLYWRKNEGATLTPISFEPGTWEARLCVRKEPKQERYAIAVELEKEGRWLRQRDVKLVVEGMPGIVMADWSIAMANTHFAWQWGMYAERMPKVPLSREEIPGLLRALRHRGVDLPVVWPEEWNVRTVRDEKPTGKIELEVSPRSSNLKGSLSFKYGPCTIKATQQDLTVMARVERTDGGEATGQSPAEEVVLTRHPASEEELRSQLKSLDVKVTHYDGTVTLPIARLVEVTEQLNAAGWEVLVSKGKLRKPGGLSISVESGIDWFELHGKVQYGDTTADVSAIVEAARRGEQFVRLGDGSMGMLPEEWLSKQGKWLGLGEAMEEGGMRFAKTQVSVVDALIKAMPEAKVDEQVEAARGRLRAFEGIRPEERPGNFVGELRGYQKEGLGWLKFLEEFGFGGCLADDMGLGKTVMILAEFARTWEKKTEPPPPERPEKKPGRKGKTADPSAANPSGGWLVVGPKSLVGNWKREAAKFVPWAKVVDYTGGERKDTSFDGADIVVTSYGTMRLDIEPLSQRRWSCIVLDEAQTIKNDASLVAKASRLLRGDRRIALSGTPVENRLEDLWSIFEFLNPGMLGSVKAFTSAIKGDEDELTVLRRALKPFILRRTKREVAKDLPDKTEQTIKCELVPGQKKVYESLRKHYRELLLKKVDKEGMNKSKMHVLEALLRLRQAACHTALLPEHSKQHDSGKIDTLIDMVEEVVGEGHQVLVFSQFTSLLDLVQKRLVASSLSIARLDGSTSAKSRDLAVRYFQEGKANVFLLSLKAGGVGLNLTAAEYVFLLDPWWNPAVEAQAIDRAHRIGQQKNVFAYKLISAGTVEERILELQARKKALADAIVSGSEGPLSSLTREELEWLLG